MRDHDPDVLHRDTRRFLPGSDAARRRLLALGAALVLLAAVAGAGAPGVHARATAEADGERPVGIRIPAIGVDAPVEVRTTVRTQMQDPTDPKVVAWYDDTASLGEPGGNAVLAGHLDYAGHGPAVFARLKDLDRGDPILVEDTDGTTYRYRVVARRVVDAAAGPWDELTGPTKQQSLTLITCAPPWDDALGHYAKRLVVRAVRVRQ